MPRSTRGRSRRCEESSRTSLFKRHNRPHLATPLALALALLLSRCSVSLCCVSLLLPINVYPAFQSDHDQLSSLSCAHANVRWRAACSSCCAPVAPPEAPLCCKELGCFSALTGRFLCRLLSAFVSSFRSLLALVDCPSHSLVARLICLSRAPPHSPPPSLLQRLSVCRPRSADDHAATPLHHSANHTPTHGFEPSASIMARRTANQPVSGAAAVMPHDAAVCALRSAPPHPAPPVASRPLRRNASSERISTARPKDIAHRTSLTRHARCSSHICTVLLALFCPTAFLFVGVRQSGEFEQHLRALQTRALDISQTIGKLQLRERAPNWSQHHAQSHTRMHAHTHGVTRTDRLCIGARCEIVAHRSDWIHLLVSPSVLPPSGPNY